MKFIPTVITTCFITSCSFSQGQAVAQKMDFEKYDPVRTY